MGTSIGRPDVAITGKFGVTASFDARMVALGFGSA
jgi:hypothetical protein